MTVQYLPGYYADVMTWIDGRLMVVTSDGPIVRCYLEPALVNPQPIWEQKAPEPLLWCRGAVQGQLTVTVHQGQSGEAWLVSNVVRGLGPTFGVQPVGIDAHEAYVISGPGRYQRLGLMQQAYPFPPGVPQDSSQGLSDVQPDGTLWFADVHRSVTIGGTVFTYPNQRWTEDAGAVTVGQVDPPGIAAAFAGKVTRVIEGDAFEPHVTVSPSGRVAICARTPRGAAYVVTTIAELSE